MEKKIEDLKNGDTVKGICANLQAISNNKGLLYLHNELIKIFMEVIK
jgi:hypothetical protein